MKESETLELKKSTSELKEAIISITSILNKHHKGDLYFGIKNNGEITGQNTTENTIREITQSIANHIEPKIYPKINETRINGKQCVHVQFAGEDTPYFAFGRAYMRVGDEDKQLSTKEIEKMILQKNKTTWEEGISERTINDINEKTVKEFIERANAAKRINFTFANLKTTLNKLGLIKDGKLLRAAEALFSDKNDLEVQAAVFAGKDKLTFLDIKQLKGNIFNLLEQSESYIKEHINWRAELTERGRKEIPEIPLRAITEALVNSFCHRDYTNKKGNEIAIFKDRIEIYNPGQFPEGYSPEDFIKGAERSILRNPIIANTLYLSKDIERWGSGLKRIYDTCKEEKTKTEFKELKSGFLVVFHRKEGFAKTTTPKTTPEKIHALIKKAEINERQTQAIRYLQKHNSITSTAYATMFKITDRQAREDLSKLVSLNLLVREGKARQIKYKINPEVSGSIRKYPEVSGKTK